MGTKSLSDSSCQAFKSITYIYIVWNHRGKKMLIEITVERGAKFTVNMANVLYIQEYPTQGAIVFSKDNFINTGIPYDQLMQQINDAMPFWSGNDNDKAWPGKDSDPAWGNPGIQGYPKKGGIPRT